MLLTLPDGCQASVKPGAVAIVQVRLGSARLPGKALEPIYDKPLLEHIVERIRACQSIKHIVVATTTNTQDSAIVELGEKLGLGIFRGSEENVLERFHGAARAFKAEVIVRVTADDPFKDPEVIDYAVTRFLAEGFDYCSNTIYPSYPDGLDVEVFSFRALDQAYREARLPSEKEHVTPYIWNHPELFKLLNFTHSPDLSQHRWTLDYENDLRFAREVYQRLYPQKRVFLMQDILDLLKKEPELSSINAGVRRNEAYWKSIIEEKETP